LLDWDAYFIGAGNENFTVGEKCVSTRHNEILLNSASGTPDFLRLDNKGFFLDSGALGEKPADGFGCIALGVVHQRKRVLHGYLEAAVVKVLVHDINLFA
jgi:hypothetical protein